MGLFLHGFFSINIVGPSHLWILNPQYFQSAIGNPQMQRAKYMHCSKSFYIRDLTIYGFWYLWGILDQSLMDTEGLL